MGAGSGSRGGRGREAPSASTRAARTGRGAQTLASVRRERILESLRLAGAVSLGELAEMLAVSDMTVRRDLEALHRDGLIERVRGGAVVPQSRTRVSPEARRLWRLHHAGCSGQTGSR